jgi:hypothetical protein
MHPISPARVADLVARLIDDRSPGWVRVVIDGAPPTAPESLARGVVDPLAARGRFTQLIGTDGFWLPASQRLEQGRMNPESFYYNWIDIGALEREVLAPLSPDGNGRVLPSRWNPETDRATRAGYVEIPPRGVVVVHGQLLLGGPLSIDLSVHLDMSDAALARRLDPGWHWTLPAYRRYRDEVAPQEWADVVVRMDDPRHPALARPVPVG